MVVGPPIANRNYRNGDPRATNPLLDARTEIQRKIDAQRRATVVHPGDVTPAPGVGAARDQDDKAKSPDNDDGSKFMAVARAGGNWPYIIGGIVLAIVIFK